MLLPELLEQSGQRRRDLCELRFLRGDIQSPDVSLGELPLQDIEHVRIDGDQLAGRLDLRTQRSLLYRSRHHIGAQRDVRRDHLVAHRLFLRLCGLDGAVGQTE